MNERMEFSADLLRPATADKNGRMVTVRAYSGAAVDRIDLVTGNRYTLRLGLESGQVRMGRMQGAPVLDSHWNLELRNQIGVVERAWIDGGAMYATLRFSSRPEVEPIWQDVRDGIIRNVSIGAVIYQKRKDAEGEYTATDWEPLEISLVTVPADARATVLAHGGDGKQILNAAHGSRKDNGMQTVSTNNQAAGEQITACSVAELEKLAGAFGLQDDRAFVEGLAAGATREAAYRALNERAVARYEQAPTHSRAAIVRDEGDGLIEAMSLGLYARLSGKQPSERAREYANLRIPELAREYCRARNIPARGTSDYVRLAFEHTTSDFPNLLTGTGQRLLLDSYNAATPAIKAACRETRANDFRELRRLRLGEAPQLLEVPEGAEITSGTRAEVAESYRLKTFARRFGISRQAIVNDDLNAFADFFRAFGQAAAQAMSQEIVNLLTSNSGAGPTLSDGVTLFHSSRGNLAASGGAISDTTLSAARLALRTVKGIDGVTTIAAPPRYLLVPAAQETAAEKYLAGIYPSQAQDVNPFSQRLELLVEPLLDAASSTRWYLAADPAIAPVLEFALLAEAPGPQVEQRIGFEYLGFEWRAYLDFGCGAIGWRGMFANPGA